MLPKLPLLSYLLFPLTLLTVPLLFSVFSFSGIHFGTFPLSMGGETSHTKTLESIREWVGEGRLQEHMTQKGSAVEKVFSKWRAQARKAPFLQILLVPPIQLTVLLTDSLRIPLPAKSNLKSKLVQSIPTSLHPYSLFSPLAAGNIVFLTFLLTVPPYFAYCSLTLFVVFHRSFPCEFRTTK